MALPLGAGLAEHPRSGRHRIAIRRDGDREHLVKSSDSSQGVWAEGWFYARHGGSLAFAPRCVELDREGRTVVLELRPGARDAQALSEEDPLRGLHALTALAEPLAELHELPIDQGAPAARPALPQVARPWVSDLQAGSPALRDCLRDLQGRRQLVDGYEAWRAGLRADAITHGDVKPDNVIVSEAGVELIDWELAGRGDASVDVGALIGSMASIWIEALDLSADGSAEEWVSAGRVPYGALRTAVEGFLRGYRHRGHGDDWARGAVRWAAFWLVARAVGEASLSLAYAPRTMLKVRVADSLSRRPASLLRPRAPSGSVPASGAA